MDVWSWISELPNSVDWNESDSPLKFELASEDNNSTRSIELKAERTSGSDSDAAVTFTVCLQGFHPFNTQKPLWVSEKCNLSPDNQNPFLPLLLQLLQEIISHSPTAHDSTCPRSQLQKLKPEPISWIMDSHTPESLSNFFNLVFTVRLFWLCVCDAPSEAGSLYFRSLLAPTLETASSKILRTFFLTVGVDTELCFMRTLGYIIAKSCIIKELGVGLQTLLPSPSPPRKNPRFSYAAEANGLWVLKGYAPVMTMKLARTNGQKSQFRGIDAKESILRYALAHHQLEAHVQLEYTVGFHDGFIQVRARVDNIRLHVARLGFNKDGDDVDFIDEKHFPSRVRVWVGPEIGAAYVGGLSLGPQTEEREKGKLSITNCQWVPAMDAEAEATSPAAAVSRWKFEVSRRYQHLLDKATPYVAKRWLGCLVVALVYALRVYMVEGFYIVSYGLGIYILNLLIGFLSPQVDPEVQDSGGPSLPTSTSDEFRPFVRRLPEFKFWYSITKAFCIAFVMTFFSAFDVPVFWPILLFYWVTLFTLTMRRQIAHMIRYKYVPFSFGKMRYDGKRASAESTTLSDD